jgi:hypothetical protein
MPLLFGSLSCCEGCCPFNDNILRDVIYFVKGLGEEFDKCALRDVILLEYTGYMDGIAALLERLRDKGWSDKLIGEAIGKPPETIYRWRTRKMPCRDAKLVGDALRRLLRRAGPPKKARPGRPSRAQQPSPKHD